MMIADAFANRDSEPDISALTYSCDECSAMGLDNPAEYALRSRPDAASDRMAADLAGTGTHASLWFTLCGMHYGELPVEARQAYLRLDDGALTF